MPTSSASCQYRTFSALLRHQLIVEVATDQGRLFEDHLHASLSFEGLACRAPTAIHASTRTAARAHGDTEVKASIAYGRPTKCIRWHRPPTHRAIYRLCWDLPELFWQRQRSTGAVTAATFIVHRSPPSRRARRKCFGRGAAINVAVPAGSTVIPVYTGSTIITVHAESPPTTTSYTVSPPAAAICYLLHHRRRLKS